MKLNEWDDVLSEKDIHESIAEEKQKLKDARGRLTELHNELKRRAAQERGGVNAEKAS